MKYKLPDSVASIQDVNSIIDEIEAYLQWFNHENTKKQLGVKSNHEQPILSNQTTELLRTISQTKPLSQALISELIDELKKFTKNARTISIVLATPPTASVKNSLVGWCRKNISSEVLVNIKFNSNILGGMVVRCGSRIFDWSFRRKIIANKSNLIGAINNVR